MNKIILIFIALLTGAANVSCHNEDELNVPESVSPIVAADLPESGKPGQEIKFKVSHIVFNGCGYFSSQETSQIGNTFNVTFYAKYRGGVCTMNIPRLETDYTFIPTEIGTFTFKFNGGESGQIIRTIAIN
jgi:hypothetical protein